MIALTALTAGLSMEQKAEDTKGIHAGLFDMDMGPVSAELKSRLEANKESLIADTRWAGVEWNSDNGLPGLLLDLAMRLRDKFGGPDHLPENR